MSANPVYGRRHETNMQIAYTLHNGAAAQIGIVVPGTTDEDERLVPGNVILQAHPQWRRSSARSFCVRRRTTTTDRRSNPVKGKQK
jgi:hypothetical protein